MTLKRRKILVTSLLGISTIVYLYLGVNFQVDLSSRISKIYKIGNVENQHDSIMEVTIPNQEDILMNLQEDLPNLPIAYWNENGNKVRYKNKTCAQYPSIYDIQFDNIYWQTFRTNWATIQMFNAYYDVRPLSTIGPAIRILAMIDRMTPPVNSYCQIWFENEKEPAIVRTWEYKYIWYAKWGGSTQGSYQPHLISCLVPKVFQDKKPAVVSIVENKCDNATNSLRVIFNKAEVEVQKKDFAVCVKGLDYLHEDISVRLVEWIELLGLLGAEKIYFYKLQVHPNVSKVLDYYVQRNKIEVTPITLTGGQPNFPTFQHMYLKKKIANKRKNEIIPYNDCLYKNMYRYKYITLLDIDEVIMPNTVRNWEELLAVISEKSLKETNEKNPATYVFRNVYFLDELSHKHGWVNDTPKYLHMLQHTFRAFNFTKPGEYVKCFHDPQKVLTLHNHFPFACLGRKCSRYYVETNDAKLQHYRADCVTSLKKSCQDFKENSVNDTAIWKFKTQLIEAATTTLYQLGFIT